MNMSQQNRAEEILTESGALLNGHFLLTSGKHAGQYMQCAKVQQYPKRLEEIAEIIAGGFAGDQVDIVVAPAIGGIVIGYELARKLGAKAIFTERVDGKVELRRGFEISKGAKVVIAEDVITTGLSTKEVIDVVNEHGGKLVGVGIIVDRTGGSIQLGTKVVSAYAKNITAYDPQDCPLCKESGQPPIKPGSR